jgi:hypothetical protein
LQFLFCLKRAAACLSYKTYAHTASYRNFLADAEVQRLSLGVVTLLGDVLVVVVRFLAAGSFTFRCMKGTSATLQCRTYVRT